MSLKPDDLAQVILDSIDDDEPPTALYTLNIHEARMLAHAALNVVQADARVGRVSDEAEIAASEAYAQGAGERPFSQRMRAAITAALPHLNAVDNHPWEPLAPGDPLNAGDEVWREWRGVSTRGIVDVQHPDSQVYTAERGHLGHRAIGTWYVRRAALNGDDR